MNLKPKISIPLERDMKLSLRLMVPWITVLLLFVACGSQAEPATSSKSSGASQQSGAIAASEAARHVGERTTVCGEIVDSIGSNGKPTFLNFDKPYPNHPFVVVIWGIDRSKFPSNPEKHYLKKKVCASGLIESYKGKPQIIANDKDQLSIGN